MLRPQVVLIDLAVTVLSGAGGVGGAWWLRRRTSLSIANLCPLAATALIAVGVAVAARSWPVAMVLLPVAAPCLAGVAAGWRWRTADLGAGEELRNHELARRWIWQPAPVRSEGERVYLRGQGELVRERRLAARREVRVDDRAARARPAARAR